MKAASNKYGPILICTALAAAALIAFEPVRHNGFVDLDDPLYVTENPNVKNGSDPPISSLGLHRLTRRLLAPFDFGSVICWIVSYLA